MGQVRQAPVGGKATKLHQMLAIATHPAFRIGFLDAQHGRPLDHDRILERIEQETKPTALQRIGWRGMFSRKEVEVAQYRYEEGRLVVKQFGCKCRAWGHPDYPPAQVVKMCERLAAERVAGEG